MSRLLNSLLILAALCFGAPQSLAISKSQCLSPALQISEVSLQPFLKRLPARLSLPQTDKEILALYTTATEKFKNEFPKSRILKLVGKVQVGESRDFSKSKIQELKDARKLSQVMRSSFYLFGANHEPPPEYDDFVRNFGKMNDKLRGDSLKKVQKAQAKADLVMEHLRSGDYDASSYAPQLSTAKSFQIFLRKIRSKILSATDTESMSTDSFHDLRKWMRDFKILFDLKNMQEGTKDSEATAAYLDMLNSSLGDAKDEFMDEEGQSDSEVAASVTPDQRILIREFISRIEIP